MLLVALSFVSLVLVHFLFLCIVCYFISGTCETQGLKRGRLKMYGQDGAVVVHELRHQTRIQELFESVKEHQMKIY